jgi:hypothetical protein
LGDGLAGFISARAIDLDFTGEDHGLGFLARIGETALDESKVQAFAGRLWRHKNQARRRTRNSAMERNRAARSP